MSEACGCKGIRTCLLCEGTSDAHQGPFEEADKPLKFFWCQSCGQLIQKKFEGYTCKPACLEIVGRKGRLRQTNLERDDSQGSHFPEFCGVTVVEDFIDEKEERTLLEQIDAHRWAESQSGRRKQDYGPKVNFKRQKVQLGRFDGLPSFIKPALSHMNSHVASLKEFVPVELCCLDYRPERGASIDPHTDDCWIWGEKLVTLNLLSSTVLTFSTPPPPSPVHNASSCSASGATPAIEVEVLLPRRSLVVVEGPARHRWLHSIQRQHITARRVAITLRELATEFLPGGENEAVGRSILERALCFDGHPINFNRTAQTQSIT